MIGRVLRAGDRALLLETVDTPTTMAVHEAVRAAQLPLVQELVPAARTLLVRVVKGTDLAAFGEQLREVARRAETAEHDGGVHDPIFISVRYDGPDLAEVSELTGMSRAALIAAHTGTPWRVGFLGFSPGFAYLVGGDRRLAVPRREQSRTHVPAGSVALGGEYSAVYPRLSPGGWQLIGHTDVALWDEHADPATPLHPGRWVRFVEDVSGVGAPADRTVDVTAGSVPAEPEGSPAC